MAIPLGLEEPFLAHPYYDDPLYSHPVLVASGTPGGDGGPAGAERGHPRLRVRFRGILTRWPLLWGCGLLGSVAHLALTRFSGYT